MLLRTLLITATFIRLLHVPTLAAQQRVGSLHGTVRERVDTRSARAAIVSLVESASESSPTITARPDAQGQFHVDSLLPGRYLIQVGIPTLDSLEISLPAERIEIEPGKTSRFDVTLPSGTQLRDVVCQGLRLSEGKVAIAGHATNADTDRPLPGADVVALGAVTLLPGLVDSHVHLVFDASLDPVGLRSQSGLVSHLVDGVEAVDRTWATRCRFEPHMEGQNSMKKLLITIAAIGLSSAAFADATI